MGGLGSGVWVLRVRDQGSGIGAQGIGVWCSGSAVWGLRFRVWGSGLRAQGIGEWGLASRVWGLQSCSSPHRGSWPHSAAFWNLGRIVYAIMGLGLGVQGIGLSDSCCPCLCLGKGVGGSLRFGGCFGGLLTCDDQELGLEDLQSSLPVEESRVITTRDSNRRAPTVIRNPKH